jgi:hypothetical protein
MVMNALTWIRGVEDRVDRKDPAREGGWRPAGLLACLRDGSQLKEQIQAAFNNMRPALADARRFDNYALHAGAIPGGQTPGFQIKPDGTVYFQFPDATSQRIATWELFEYKNGRDAVSYLDDLFDNIADFVDGMLDAFDAQP